MLGLKLRNEFLGAHMPGTAITLRTSDNQGTAQKSPEHILSITYPTADVQKALKAISAKNTGGTPADRLAAGTAAQLFGHWRTRRKETETYHQLSLFEPWIWLNEVHHEN